MNVLLHGASAVLVFLLLERWLAAGRTPETRAAAFLGAALWALHPVAADTVTYVSSRSMGLSTLLVLGALFLVARDEPPTPAQGAGAFLLAFLAPLAKETALVLPLLVAWWEATLGPRGVALRDRARRLGPVASGAVLAALVLLAVPRHRELVAFSLATRAPLDALRGNVQAVPAMLGLWAFPWRISIDPAAPAAFAWTEAPTLVRLALLAALASVALAARRRAPWAAFAAGFLLLALAPGNSLLWRLDPVAVRPLYLASVGPAALFAAVVASLSTPALRRGAFAFGAAVALALAAGLASRNALYASPAALWEDAARKAPGSARCLTNLGFAYLAEGRLDEAEAALTAADARDPGGTSARCGLAALRIRRDTIAFRTTEGTP